VTPKAGRAIRLFVGVAGCLASRHPLDGKNRQKTTRRLCPDARLRLGIMARLLAAPLLQPMEFA
jgi:hypothetical protein